MSNTLINDTEELQAIIASSPDLYLILNPQLEIVAVSNAYLKATMVKREDILGHNIFEIFPDNPADKSATGVKNLSDSLKRVLTNKVSDALSVLKYDIRKPKEKGGEFEERYWSPFNIPVLNDANEVIYIIHRVEDVTPLVQLKESDIKHHKLTQELSTKIIKMQKEVMERAKDLQVTNKKLLKANQQLEMDEQLKSQLASIVENTEDAVISKDLNGIILSWNKGAEKLYGYTSQEIVGEPVTRIFPTDRLDEYKEAMMSIRKDVPLHYLETERVHKDGHIIPVSVTISPMQNNKGELIGACSIARDITAWKKVENLKNEFVSIVSHELRTPLTSIRGSIGLLLGGAVGNFSDKAKKLLEIANNNCERLLLLINDILDIEKIEAGKMDFQFRVVDIVSLVNEAININKSYSDKYNVKIKSIFTVKKINVNVDSARLLQVLTNLISNAVKFSPPSGQVTLDIKTEEEEVRVSVTDQGPGIPESFKSHIFKKFSQADTSLSRNKSGTGLGLSISKAIIEKLNGSLSFDSKDGLGTTFYFTLPIWFKKSPAVKKPIQHKKTQNRLLICEDDEDQARYLKLILESKGFDCDIAQTAAETKNLLQENDYQALLLDILLPDKDGITLIRELRHAERTNTLPIIVLSVMAKTGRNLINGEVLSVVDWLDKPIDFNKLLEDINLIIKHKKQLPHILHVEDDRDTQHVVATLLLKQAKVTGCVTLKEAYAQLENNHYDLVILDLLLPDGNGIELLPELAKKMLPVIVYSAIDLDREHAKYVYQTLLKSRISHQELITTIRNLLALKKEVSEQT